MLHENLSIERRFLLKVDYIDNYILGIKICMLYTWYIMLVQYSKSEAAFVMDGHSFTQTDIENWTFET